MGQELTFDENSRDDGAVSWALTRRFEFIEWRLFWYGRVNRKDLETKFGMSTPQASIDLRRYQQLAPGNLEYDSSEKAYRPSRLFVPLVLQVSADRFLLQMRSVLEGAIRTQDTWFDGLPPIGAVPTVTRQVEAATLRHILLAILHSREVDVVYQSFSHPTPQLRALAPHALAYDGFRWHVRAWCAQRRDFRDFVLTRIASVSDSRPAATRAEDDVEWDRTFTLRLVPHPGLQPGQRAAVEQDYGMTKGVLEIPTRVSLAFYFIRRLNLDADAPALPPERQQICLENLEEYEAARRSARAESSGRVTERG